MPSQPTLQSLRAQLQQTAEDNINRPVGKAAALLLLNYFPPIAKVAAHDALLTESLREQLGKTAADGINRPIWQEGARLLLSLMPSNGIR